jgi:hypothetical protein
MRELFDMPLEPRKVGAARNRRNDKEIGPDGKRPKVDDRNIAAIVFIQQNSHLTHKRAKIVLPLIGRVKTF